MKIIVLRKRESLETLLHCLDSLQNHFTLVDIIDYGYCIDGENERREIKKRNVNYFEIDEGEILQQIKKCVEACSEKYIYLIEASDELTQGVDFSVDMLKEETYDLILLNMFYKYEEGIYDYNLSFSCLKQAGEIDKNNFCHAIVNSAGDDYFLTKINNFGSGSKDDSWLLCKKRIGNPFDIFRKEFIFKHRRITQVLVY